MSSVNPYQAPGARLDVAGQEEYSEVKFFSTKGRLGRVRYITYSIGYVLIMYLAIAVVFGFLAATGQMRNNAMVGLTTVLTYALFIAATLVLTRRRAHDFDKSGWWGLLALVPLVGLMFWFIPGTDGENRYGKKTPPNKGGVLLLVAVLLFIFVVGILAAIAIPAYQDYVQKARATQGQIVAPAE